MKNTYMYNREEIETKQKEIEAVMFSRIVENAIINARLTPKETFVLSLRFGLSIPNQSLAIIEIAKIMNLSPERVQQISSKALIKVSSSIGKGQNHNLVNVQEHLDNE
jgi:DNA-directed RNA polymerase sigma subunit (sigma70/sigma32)